MDKPNPIEIQKHLRGVEYPASKQEIVEHLERSGADESVRSILERLPDRWYDTAADVSKEVGNLE